MTLNISKTRELLERRRSSNNTSGLSSSGVQVPSELQKKISYRQKKIDQLEKIKAATRKIKDVAAKLEVLPPVCRQIMNVYDATYQKYSDAKRIILGGSADKHGWNNESEHSGHGWKEGKKGRECGGGEGEGGSVGRGTISSSWVSNGTAQFEPSLLYETSPPDGQFWRMRKIGKGMREVDSGGRGEDAIHPTVRPLPKRGRSAVQGRWRCFDPHRQRRPQGKTDKERGHRRQHKGHPKSEGEEGEGWYAADALGETKGMVRRSWPFLNGDALAPRRSWLRRSWPRDAVGSDAVGPETQLAFFERGRSWPFLNGDAVGPETGPETQLAPRRSWPDAVDPETQLARRS
uniref:Uncharacterized protein n=1 Tax=Globodera rostochiensis TaxID=31243 RepID=A0A914HUB6_GLORO